MREGTGQFTVTFFSWQHPFSLELALLVTFLLFLVSGFVREDILKCWRVVIPHTWTE